MKLGIRLAILAGATALSLAAAPVQAAPAGGLEAFRSATTGITGVEKAYWYRRHYYHRYYYRPYWRRHYWHRHYYRPYWRHHYWHHRYYGPRYRHWRRW